jgi:hypothetical protein
MGKNFLTATGPADISWAKFEEQAAVTPELLAELPEPDVALDQETTWLKYEHRQLKDADVYFFFNEGGDPLDLKATVAANAAAAQAQVWDGRTGAIAPLPGATFASGKAVVPLKLGPWETKLVVISGH